MSVDHYAGAERRWAEGAALVYGPIANHLVGTTPHPLSGHTVLDVGAGTGVATTALATAGALAIAADLSRSMLAWGSEQRPPAVVGDICALPFRDDGADDVVASFVLNHLVNPTAGLKELGRVTRPGGAVLACVFSNASQNDARDAIDRAAQEEGWRVPAWYTDLKQTAVPLLGTPEDMERAAEISGLADIVVSEHPVDVGVNEPEQLVAYRLGQANFSDWLDQVGPERRGEIRARLAETIRPIMRPYRPLVVFLSALVP